MMYTRRLRALGMTVALGLSITACGDGQATEVEIERSLGAANDHTVLILGPSVAGGASSREAIYAVAAGYSVEIVTAAGWAAKTLDDFASYRALILGDPNCQINTTPVAAAIANRNVWGRVVNGNVILVGTDPVVHPASGGNLVTQGAVQFAAAEPGLTGAYISLSCYYHAYAVNTPVPLLEPFQSATTGVFTVRGVGCFNNAHKVATHPALAGITDVTLSNWGCSVHEAFDHFPTDFLPLAIARGSLGSGTVSFADGSTGVPYIMARGRTLVPANCGNAVVESPEQCDDGNTTNCDGCSAQCKTENPACGNGLVECGEQCDDGNLVQGDGCSNSCTTEVCGNGIVNPGEQCDDGNTAPGDGCSSTCQTEAHPPVAKCANRTVVANGTCSVNADVNDGSSDPDGNLVGCTQAPAGPYTGVGPHPVTLTCTDTTGLSASCTAVVTAVDETPPAIACPADMLVNTPTTSAVVTYPSPTTGDNCGVLPVNCSIPSGSTLPLGDHAVTCQVQDLGGNTNSCSFNIHVNAPPDAICTDVIVAAGPTCSGDGSISNNPTDPDGDSFVCVQTPPAPYGLGDNTAVLTCTDEHGTSDSCSATVQVVDMTPPAITCPDSMSFECTNQGTVVTYAASATDNCSVSTPTCTPPSGSTFPVGNTTATCTAADGSGNASSCGFSVTVTDTQQPVVTTTSVMYWPPNHKYKSFQLSDCVTSIVDSCQGPLTLEDTHAHITRITSDELEDDKLVKGGKGDGDTCNDIVLTGPMSADLRVERSGGSNGRLYTVYFDLADANGNVTSSSCKVQVPHDQSLPNTVVDDGCKYCVGTGCGTCPGHDPVCTN